MKTAKIGDSILINEDCLKAMEFLIEKGIKVDAIITDPPYGTTACKWDSAIPLELMWDCLNKLIKDLRVVVLFSQQPFTSSLISSNITQWKYNWVWEKDNGTNFLNSKYQPLKITEDICVFGHGATSFTKDGRTLIYNPQFGSGKPYKCVSGKQKQCSAVVRDKGTREGGALTDNKGIRYPKNLVKFNRDKDKLHPTQKPVALMEYLIKTYTNENEIVLDFTMGSGTTGVACQNTNRRFIGIEFNPEKDKEGNLIEPDKYFKVAVKRLQDNLTKGEEVNDK